MSKVKLEELTDEDREKMKPRSKYEDLSDEQREEIKFLYLGYTPVSQIARQFGINRTTLQYHVSKYWAKERDLAKIENYNKFVDTKKINFVKMKTSSIEIIQKALGELAKRGMALLSGLELE